MVFTPGWLLMAFRLLELKAVRTPLESTVMAEPDSTNSASAAGEEASATTEKSELLGNKVFVPKLSELREVIRDRLLVTVKATATPRTIRLSKNVFSYAILLFECYTHKM